MTGFYEGQCVVVIEDDILTLTKITKFISSKLIQLSDFKDPVHISKIHEMEVGESLSKRYDFEDVMKDIDSYDKLIGQIINSDVGEDVVIDCVMCDGSGFDGHDREDPPNPYFCRYCGGSGKFKMEKVKKEI